MRKILPILAVVVAIVISVVACQKDNDKSIKILNREDTDVNMDVVNRLLAFKKQVDIRKDFPTKHS